MVLGIILHATFDYSALTTEIQNVSYGPLDMQAALSAPLEISVMPLASQVLRDELAPLIMSVLLLIIIAVFLRLVIGQSDRKSIVPAVVIIVAALILGSAWMIKEATQIPTVEVLK